MHEHGNGVVGRADSNGVAVLRVHVDLCQFVYALRTVFLASLPTHSVGRTVTVAPSEKAGNLFRKAGKVSQPRRAHLCTSV